MAKNGLGLDIPDSSIFAPEDSEPYLVWCDFWDESVRKFGFSCNTDIFDWSSHYRRLMSMIVDRHPEVQHLSTYIYGKTSPLDMNEDQLKLKELYDKYKKENTLLPEPVYCNFWHAVLNMFKVRGYGFKRDTFNFWKEEWFDLKLWEPVFWPRVMWLDQMTKGHPARSEKGLNLFIYW